MIAESDKFQWKYVIEAVTDWQLIINLFVYWGTVGPLYGMSTLAMIIDNIYVHANTIMFHF